MDRKKMKQEKGEFYAVKYIKRCALSNNFNNFNSICCYEIHIWRGFAGSVLRKQIH